MPLWFFFVILQPNVRPEVAKAFVFTMKKFKKRILPASNLDVVKAMRRGGREAEMEMLGPGFHSHNKIHKSEKIYTRKKKHKGGW